MTSREIAELTGKNHPDVMRGIRAMVDQLTKAEVLSCAKSTTYTGKDGRRYPQYELDKETCLNLLLGYDAVARMRVVKRWQQLEQTAPALTATTPQETALVVLKVHLEVAAMFSCPVHLAQIEAVKAVKVATGVDFSQHLLSAPAQSSIKPDEEMLEPTELGKLHGLKPHEMNLKLAALGLQVRANSEWVATEKGAPLCSKHAWAKGNKSGYNFKWHKSINIH
jgi:hypothetical protein